MNLPASPSGPRYQPIHACQICGAEGGSPLLTKARGVYSSTWVACVDCQSARIDPYPSPHELTAYYNAGYTEMDFSGTADGQVDHRLRFSAGYEPTIFNEYRYSLSDAGIDATQMAKHYVKILDYGCANGVFLKFLLHSGAQPESIYGCDVSSDMLQRAKVFTSNLFEAGRLEQVTERFDLITLWDVIEHVHDPCRTLQKLVGLLAEGGEILVQTPQYGVLAELMGARWSHYLVIEHINLFSRPALMGIFERLDMQCISASSFGANIDASCNDAMVKSTFDRLSKRLDFGATQVLRLRKA